MGRIKQGLDYFPMSTSFMHDRIVRRVMKREGDAAFATLVETLSYIYAGKGYYIPASDEFYDELTDSLYNTDLDDVKRIIALAVECGLFDSGLFRQYGILTSADIQRQYLFITKRRSSSLIAPAYCLLEAEELASYHTSPNSKNSAEDADNKTGCDVTPTADTVTSTTDSATSEAEMSTLGTQNKEKQIKTNQNKLNHLSDSPQGENGGGKILKRRKVMTQEEIDNGEEMPVTLTLDDGREIERDVLTIFPAGGKDYIALLPMDDIEAEDGEVYLYRYSEDENGQPNLENIEDDDEYEIVADAFDELLDEQE